jgi:hypothetical protein
MAAEHAYGTAGSGFTMHTLPHNRNNGYASTSGNAQHQLTSGAGLDYDHDQLDSGFFDTNSSNAQSYRPKPAKLLDWQDQILRLWSANNLHVSSDTDIILFRGLLRASEDSIKARLQQLFEDSHALQNTSCYITSTLSDDSSNSQSSQKSVNVTAEELGKFEAGLENNVAMRSSYTILQKPSESKEFISTSHSAPHAGYSDNHCHSEAHFGLKNTIPLPQDSRLAFSTNTKMEAEPTSLTRTTCYQAPIPDPHDHSLPYNVDFSNPLGAYSAGMHVTKALMHLIQTVVRRKKAKGCGLLRGHEGQTGAFPCTIGCARRFKSSCDLFRHEEIVFPQQFWFCFVCGDPTHPSERHLFTREDKMRQHIKVFHPLTINIAQCKVVQVRTTFPERCTLCLHHRHRSWKERCRHIIMHCKRREDLSLSNSRNSGPPVVNSGDDDDDSGDEDDQDDDDRNPPDGDGGDDSVAHDHSRNDEGSDRSQDGPGDPHLDNGQGRDSFTGMCHWDSPGFWNFPSSIELRPLLSETCTISSGGKLTTLAIQWFDRMNKKGGTASVFKVALPIDLDTNSYVGEKTYAVKQYASNMRSSYERELQVFTALAKFNVESSRFIHCFGTFEYLKPDGQPTFNLLLEYAECDLREHFADVPRPITSQDVLGFWKSLFGVADGLHQLYTIGGVHGDLKPDNILRCNGTFKLGDFGFTDFLDRRTPDTKPEPIVHGGTFAYGKYIGF